MKNVKITTKVSILVVLALLVGFLGIWKSIDKNVTEATGNQIAHQMSDAAKDRSYIINNYVEAAEEYLEAFGQSDEVRNILLHPQDAGYTARAQQYTKDFAAVKGVFEGLYVADTTSLVLTHTMESAIGISTRTGDGLKALQDTVLSVRTLTNTGILKSPSTGNMVISMYYPIYEGNRCVGFVGGAVFAKNLMESLESLPLEGLPESEYVFLNVKNGEYLYNENEELLCTVTEDRGYLQMIEDIKANNLTDAVMLEYKDEKGVDYVVAYNYLPERDWVFAIRDTKENVYSSMDSIKRNTAIICIVTGVLVLFVMVLVLLNLGRSLRLISGSITRLGDMDLSVGKDMKKYHGRRDEIGIVCNALEKTCDNLERYINEVDRMLSAMAEGDYTSVSRVEFAGEFIHLKESMDKIQKSLRASFTEINSVTGELVVGAQSVADSSENLASAASKASMLLMEIDSHTQDVANEIAESSEFAAVAKKEAADTATLVGDSRQKMQELTDAMSQIEEATHAIEGISTNLENIAKQTNILALNALVEATRAGDSGRGFGVVADEIRILAEQAGDAAKNAFDRISKTGARVKDGVRLGEETAALLDQVVEKANRIDDSMTRIADSAASQNGKLHSIEGNLGEISQSVEMTAAMSEQSAAASIELDDQINALKDNVSRYRV